MSNVYLAADLHLGHKGVAGWRGYEDFRDHDNMIIKNWNSVVGKNDTVIIPGDLTMSKKPIDTLRLLNGRKIVVGGNHDTRGHTSKILEYVDGYVGAYEYKGYIITHIPVHPMCLDRYKGNIHGHLHEKLVFRQPMFGSKPIKDHRYFNVSLEQIEYKPIAFTALVERFNERLHGS